MKIFHTADIHLGRRRLGGRLPDQDFADAFGFVAGKAVAERSDVFLIAGDLFDRAQVEPPQLRQAQQVLAGLKDAGIPVVAIEGNHDRAFLHSEDPTWLQYLAEDNLLMLLRTKFDSAGPQLREWQDFRRGGAWVDLCGVRFVGAGYLGAATPHKVREIAAHLEAGRTHVVLLHAGPDYFTGEGGGFSREDLQALRERVCYLALGHIHRPMQHGDWACNPGSPENCDLGEVAHAGPRGYAVIEIDPARPAKPIAIEIRNTPRRACYRVELDCTAFGNKLKNGAAALVEAAVRMVRSTPANGESIIDLRLVGRLNLQRIALDQPLACKGIEHAAGVRAVAMDLGGLNAEENRIGGPADVPTLSREELERAAIRASIDNERLWGLEGHEPEFAELFYALKESARLGRSPEDLADQVSRSPLVERVQTSIASESASPGQGRP